MICNALLSSFHLVKACIVPYNTSEASCDAVDRWDDGFGSTAATGQPRPTEKRVLRFCGIKKSAHDDILSQKAAGFGAILDIATLA